MSRRALIHGTPHIILAGKSVIQHDVVIRGDLVRHHVPPASSADSSTNAGGGGASTKPQNAVSIHLGRYVFLSSHVILHPPSRLSSSSSSSSAPTFPGDKPGPTNTHIHAPSSLTPHIPTPATLTYYPLRIADHVYVGPHSWISAASIGSHVHIGARCRVGNMAIIKDNVRVLDDAVLPPGSVWPSGSVVAGRPARVVADLGDAWGAGGIEGGPGANSREMWAAVGAGKR